MNIIERKGERYDTARKGSDGHVYHITIYTNYINILIYYIYTYIYIYDFEKAV